MIKLLFFASSLFFTQMLAAVHGAEHGFEEHDHDGHVCQIFTYYQQTDHQISGTVSSIKQPVLSACAYPPYRSVDSILTNVKFPIRAPPTFS